MIEETAEGEKEVQKEGGMGRFSNMLAVKHTDTYLGSIPPSSTNFLVDDQQG